MPQKCWNTYSTWQSKFHIKRRYLTKFHLAKKVSTYFIDQHHDWISIPSSPTSTVHDQNQANFYATSRWKFVIRRDWKQNMVLRNSKKIIFLLDISTIRKTCWWNKFYPNILIRFCRNFFRYWLDVVTDNILYEVIFLNSIRQ